MLLCIESLAREKSKNEVKVAQLTAKLGKLTATLEEEKQLNISLTQNQVGATNVYFTCLLVE